MYYGQLLLSRQKQCYSHRHCSIAVYNLMQYTERNCITKVESVRQFAKRYMLPEHILDLHYDVQVYDPYMVDVFFDSFFFRNVDRLTGGPKGYTFISNLHTKYNMRRNNERKKRNILELLCFKICLSNIILYIDADFLRIYSRRNIEFPPKI